jgi:hypothetical protein
LSSAAHAQTWLPERSTPVLRELVAVDATGEPSWLFGTEDVASDGLNVFGAAEQAADVRSSYAATARDRLWLRVYVSARTAPEELRAFVFVDNDRNPNTGGPARAPEVDPALDTDVTPGGYEIALAWSGAAFLGAWRWEASGNSGNGSYRPLADLEPLEATVERGVDLDPLRLGPPQNGYIQTSLKFAPLDLGVRCDANLLVRSSSGNTLRDRDLGRAGPCVPGDGDDDGVADVAEPDLACQTDDQCPADGTCRNNRCEAPEQPATPGSGNGVGGSSGNGNGNGNGSGTAGGTGVPESLPPGEVVQGGAFTCATVSPGRPAQGGLFALSALLGLSLLRRARRRAP